VEDTNLPEFITPERLSELPPRYKSGIEQAIILFRHFEHKSGISFAPSFTSLLGPLDEAARGLIIDRLQPDVPTNPQDLESFFTPDLSSVPTTEQRRLLDNAENLRKTVVDRRGTMPIGVLRWTLNFAKSPKPVLGGIFDAVLKRFAPIATKDFVKQIEKTAAFRNTYIAHQERLLEDAAQAREALKDWIAVLYRIWKVHH
jgi:type III restriction enzyme